MAQFLVTEYGRCSRCILVDADNEDQAYDLALDHPNSDWSTDFDMEDVYTEEIK